MRCVQRGTSASKPKRFRTLLRAGFRTHPPDASVATATQGLKALQNQLEAANAQAQDLTASVTDSKTANEVPPLPPQSSKLQVVAALTARACLTVPRCAQASQTKIAGLEEQLTARGVELDAALAKIGDLERAQADLQVRSQAPSVSRSPSIVALRTHEHYP